MVKKRGLGKSLDALLSYTTPTAVAEKDVVNEQLSFLAIEQLKRGK